MCGRPIIGVLYVLYFKTASASNGPQESLLRVIISVKSSMVSGRQAAQAAAALPR